MALLLHGRSCHIRSSCHYHGGLALVNYMTYSVPCRCMQQYIAAKTLPIKIIYHFSNHCLQWPLYHKMFHGISILSNHCWYCALCHKKYLTSLVNVKSSVRYISHNWYQVHFDRSSIHKLVRFCLLNLASCKIKYQCLFYATQKANHITRVHFERNTNSCWIDKHHYKKICENLAANWFL